MQTFLPYSSFTQSARSLDRQRLGKQRVEVLQICNVLVGVKTGWGNHPITRMWEADPLALARYGMIVCKVWVSQGYKDTCYMKIRNLFPDVSIHEISTAPPPYWVGDPDFHRAHQSNLIRKNPTFYGPQFPGVPDDLPYIWPV